MQSDHEITRLKFAFARGARIQFLHKGGEHWSNTRSPAWWRDIDYRVHPRDEHLLYGPLSSALRDNVLYREPLMPWQERFWSAAHVLYHDELAKVGGFFKGAEEVGDSHLLFAEYLADMGL